jgi:hypothetical protein
MWAHVVSALSVAHACGSALEAKRMKPTHDRSGSRRRRGVQ